MSEDGGSTFEKFSKGPVVGSTVHEIYSATSPCVCRAGDAWHMWYSSGTHWIEVGGKLEHTYDIKYAHSEDGMRWVQTNKAAIEQRNKYEALTRPTVMSLGGTFHMWFCHRGSRDFRDGRDSYRIGYASSQDLKVWKRHDEMSGIDVSSSGWDSKMIAYPDVARVRDRVIMVYNGNDFGAEGFGYAELDE